ncbi:hypothetical protein Tco_0737549 [Tanacetum coccineum]
MKMEILLESTSNKLMVGRSSQIRRLLKDGGKVFKYDKNDLANMFAPESEETICLVEESQSKLGDLVKPYDYTKLNNLYDLFMPQQYKSREQLYFTNDVKKNLFKTPFQKQTTHLVKRIEYFPTKASMSKSNRVIDNLLIKIKNIRSVVELNWKNRFQNEWNNPITYDVEGISHKKTKNQAKSDKTGHGMEKWADYANLGNFIYKRKKGEKENEKKKDVEGLFLHRYVVSSLMLSAVRAEHLGAYDQDYFPGKRKRGKDYKEGMLAADQPRAPKGLWPSGTHVEVMCPVVGSSLAMWLCRILYDIRYQTSWHGVLYKGLLKPLLHQHSRRRELRGTEVRLLVVPTPIANHKGHSQSLGRSSPCDRLYTAGIRTLQSRHYLVFPTTAPISIEVILLDELIGCARLGQEILYLEYLTLLSLHGDGDR